MESARTWASSAAYVVACELVSFFGAIVGAGVSLVAP
jgi:hypothetical protein